MKKSALIIRVLCTVLALAALCAVFCAAFSGCSSEIKKDVKPSVVVTVFPLYDWVKQIAGDRADVTLLLDSGVDLHSYQPSADDIIKISTSDLFIFVGGESDFWVEDIISGARNPQFTPIDLIESLGERAKEEEIKEGMQAESEEAEKDEGPEYDEHIWLSLKNASVLCGVIADGLCKIDPDGAGTFRENADAYLSKLGELDREFEETVEKAKYKTVVFGDRFPFRYLVDDYGLDYFAAYTGCSAESEASFETVTFLASKVDELGLPAILQIETADGQLAETVRSATEKKDQKILTLDSLQSSVKEDVDNGKSYLDTMKKNLEVLKEAIG